MKCLNCGAELPADTKFCSYCGAKVEEDKKVPPIPETEEQNNDINGDKEFKGSFYSESMPSKKIGSNHNKVKGKCLEYWNKLSNFGKIATMGGVVLVILALVAFLAGRIVAGILSIVQIAIVVVAILMKKNTIKVPKSWIPIVALALSYVLIIPYFGLFKINSADYVKYDWSSVVLTEMLPQPESPYGEIISNSEDYLSLDVTKTTEGQYKEYIAACKDKGFTIDIETNESFFCAYNDKGYKLSLSYYDYNSEMHIDLNSAMKMETITWPDSEMAKLLPVPKSTTGKIYNNDEDSFSVYIGETTIDDYNAYVKACEEKGFTVDAQKEDKAFSAKNADSYKLSVDYKGNNVIYISIAEPEFDIAIEVECVENLIFSKYDVEMSIDDEFKGTIPHGDKKSFEVVLKRGKHTISFESAEDDTLDGEVEVEITKNETIKLNISCSSSELISSTEAKDENASETTTEPEKTEPTSESNKTDSSSQTETSEADSPAENLTIDNCPELAAILSNKAEIDESYSSFASKYKGRIIEFDGRIDYCTKHGDYNTRFDYLVSAGDYEPNHQIGPTFKFEDVNYYDLNTDLDTVSAGLNVRITAKVVSFDSNSGIFYLEPVSVEGR